MVLDRPYMTKKDRRWIIIGLSLTVIGGLLFFNFQSMLNNALKSQLQVKEGNDFTQAWHKNPFPLGLEVYIFNLENPKEFASGAKAKLKEMGPYSYDMWLYKDTISFNEDQTKVRFWESQSFDFRADSPNKLTDKVTVLNFPVYALANMVRTLINDLPLSFAIEPVAIGFVNILFMSHSESLIKELTVGELLNGYPFSILNTIDTVTRPLTWFGVQLPDSGMPDNKFGLLWTKNYTKGGPFEAQTGQKGTQLLKLLSFKDQSSLNFYDEPQCNMINGTEGSTLEVDVSKEKTYYVFTTDTCRTFDLTYEKDTWVNGIPTYRFIPNPKLFAAPSKNPENRCFCRTPEREEWCDGIFDLGRCLKGAPAAYSFPHFLGASSTLRNNVENMHPDPEIHQAFIDVEPFMGAPIRGAEKLQMNAIIKPINYLAGFRNFPESVLPLMWMKKSAVIDDNFTLKMRMAIWPLYFILLLIYASFFGGMALLAFAGYQVYRRRGKMLEMKNIGSIDAKRSESQEPLQLDFNNNDNQEASSKIVQTPLNSRSSVHQQSPAWHTASYSAVSRQTGSYPNDARLSSNALESLQQQSGDPSSKQRLRQVRATAPVEPVPSYPRLTYSNTTYQTPRVSPMSALSTRPYAQIGENGALVEQKSADKITERIDQVQQANYPRLTYSSTTFRNPKVGPPSVLSRRYGHAPLGSTLEKVDEIPTQTSVPSVSTRYSSQPVTVDQTAVSSEAQSSVNESYPRLTYSNTTYQGPRNAPMSAISLNYGPVIPTKSENATIQSEIPPSAGKSYPRITYSNTTYQGPRNAPMSAVSLLYDSQPVADNISIQSETLSIPYESDPRLTHSNSTYQTSQTGPISAVHSDLNESYPRLTYSNTTYKGPRTDPISATSTHYIRPTMSDSKKSTLERTSIDDVAMPNSLDEFYNDQTNAFGVLPPYSNYDNVESTWTGVNEVIDVEKSEVNEVEKIATKENIKSTVKNANEGRITWSPPGSVN